MWGKGALSSLSPSPCKAWKGSGREADPFHTGHVQFLSPALMLQSLAQAFPSAPAEPPAPNDSLLCCAQLQHGLWKLLLAGPWSALTHSGREMLQQSILRISLPFAIPAPSSESLGRLLPTPWCGTLPLPSQCCVPASSPSLLMAARLCFSCFFPGFPLCCRLGMVQSSLQHPLLRGCC